MRRTVFPAAVGRSADRPLYLRRAWERCTAQHSPVGDSTSSGNIGTLNSRFIPTPEHRTLVLLDRIESAA
jgi:hypothetical protein